MSDVERTWPRSPPPTTSRQGGYLAGGASRSRRRCPRFTYATGDLSPLRDDLRPDPHLPAHPAGRNAGRHSKWRPGALAPTRSSACATPVSYPPRPVAATTSCASWSTSWGAPVTWATTCRCSWRSLALRGDDRRGPQWRKADLAPDTDFRVVVIGAGMSGILTAYRLAQAGIDYTVVEKNADVGGTWFGEHVSGQSGRQPEPQLQLLLRAAHRLAAPLLRPARKLHEYLHDCARRLRRARPASGSAPRCARSLGTSDTATWSVVVGGNSDGTDETHRRQRGRAARSASSTARNFPEIPGIEDASQACLSTRRSGTTTRRSTARELR